jgi:hypothetical protein
MFPLAYPLLKRDIPSFDQVMLAKAVPELIEQWLGERKLRGTGPQHTDPVDLPWRTRLGGERRGEHGSEASDEGAAVHSIT